MKQETIIRSKLWQACQHDSQALFALEFYNPKQVIDIANKIFDTNNIKINIDAVQLNEKTFLKVTFTKI